MRAKAGNRPGEKLKGRRVARELRELQNHVQSMLRTAQGFFIYRVAVGPGRLDKARVILVSPSVRDVSGIEDPYNFESWFSSLHPDDIPRIMEANERAVATGVPYDQVARWYHRLNKKWVWLRTMSQPVFNERGLLTHFNGLCIDVTARIRAEQQLVEQRRHLRALVSQLAVAEERERRRIADGLHDDISQLLAAARLKLSMLAAAPDLRKARDLAGEAGDYLDRMIKTTRSLAFDLASPVLHRFGLEPAVEDLCEKMSLQHGIRFEFSTDARAKALPEDAQTLVFHAVRELMRNVARHARAKRATVDLRTRARSMIVTVEDDGLGFDEGHLPVRGPDQGLGLFSVRERMEHLGGQFSVVRVVPHGTRVTMRVPLLASPGLSAKATHEPGKQRATKKRR